MTAPQLDRAASRAHAHSHQDARRLLGRRRVTPGALWRVVTVALVLAGLWAGFFELPSGTIGYP